MEELTAKSIHELCKWHWYDYVRYYGFYFWWNWLELRPLKIKSFFQRGWKGWANEDTWAFDGYLAKVISEGCKHLKIYQQGIPGEIYEKYRNDLFLTQEEAENLAQKEWIKILDKIILAFDLIRQIQYDGNREFYLPNLSQELKTKCNCLTKEEDDAMKEGMNLFRDWFFALWD